MSAKKHFPRRSGPPAKTALTSWLLGLGNDSFLRDACISNSQPHQRQRNPQTRTLERRTDDAALLRSRLRRFHAEIILKPSIQLQQREGGRYPVSMTGGPVCSVGSVLPEHPQPSAAKLSPQPRARFEVWKKTVNTIERGQQPSHLVCRQSKSRHVAVR